MSENDRAVRSELFRSGLSGSSRFPPLRILTETSF